MKVGVGFCKYNEEGKQYIPLVINEEVKEIMPCLKNVAFCLKEIPADKRKSDKSPDFYLDMYKPQDEQTKE